MRQVLTLLLLLGGSISPLFAQDSTDVRHYEIHLNIAQEAIDSQRIGGFASIRVAYDQVPSQFRFMLDSLQVDSVRLAGDTTAFSYDGRWLSIPTAGANVPADSTTLTVYYQGHPIHERARPSVPGTSIDSTGGGFLFEKDFAYNIGAGLSTNPHPFARTWYPVKDGFQERATYEFFIETSPKLEVFCNGALIDSSTQGGTKTYHWRLNKPIPSYLSSIAVADLERVDQMRQGIPLMLAADAQDTAAAKDMFFNFDSAAKAFKTHYGPFRWNKAGFVFTPFPLGAIEHATSVHMPNSQIFRQAETLMAHEFAHSWFGNLVTCDSASDMWLNEGWAVFSEALFLEQTYGRERYRQFLREKLQRYLQFGHTPEGDDGLFAIKDIPRRVTYGTTVYDKGCLAIATLREQMGDEDFFNAAQAYLDNFKWSHASTEDLQATFEAESGMDLSNFFDTWIKQPGFPHFAVDSFQASPQGSNYEAEVFISQRLRNAPKPYEMQVEVAAFGPGPDQRHTQTFRLSGGSQQVSLSGIPFEPEFITVDPDARIMDARLDDRKVLEAGDNSIGFSETGLKLSVESAPTDDSAFLQVSHHFIGPTNEKPNQLQISPNHYWEVKGRMPEGFKVSTQFSYNATTDDDKGYIDRGFIDPDNPEGTVLLYRKGPGQAWQLAPDVRSIIRQGSGIFLADSLRAGQYAIGRDTTTGLAQPELANDPSLRVFPNPSSGSVTLKSGITYQQGAELQVRNTMGQVVARKRINRRFSETRLKLGQLKPGIYFLSLGTKKYRSTRKLVIE